MHEVKFIKALVEDLLKRAEELGAKKIEKVYLKMGEFTEINPEIVKYYINEQSGSPLLKDCDVIVDRVKEQTLILESFDYE